MPSHAPSYKPNLNIPSTQHSHSAESEEWQRWYKLGRWVRLRQVQLIKQPLCEECKRQTPRRITAAGVVHHIIPHRGNADLFWDGDNLESVCKQCHDSSIQSRERMSAIVRSGSISLARPEWFSHAYCKVNIVCGPPAAGKSTYVKQHAGERDRVICFDEIAQRRYSRRAGERPLLSSSMINDTLRERNLLIADLMHPSAAGIGTAWIILTEPRGEARRWWCAKLNAQSIVLLTSAQVCHARIDHDAQQGDRRVASAHSFVDQWWMIYTSSSKDLCLPCPA